MEWVINLILAFFLGLMWWRKGNPYHLLWIVPCVFVGIIVLAIVTGILLGK